MLSQSLYRNLFFNGLATMIDMQRAFVSGSMMLAPVSSTTKRLVQAQAAISRDASVKQAVETARDINLTVADQEKAQDRRRAPPVRRVRRTRAAAVQQSRARAVVQARRRKPKSPRTQSATPKGRGLRTKPSRG